MIWEVDRFISEMITPEFISDNRYVIGFDPSVELVEKWQYERRFNEIIQLALAKWWRTQPECYSRGFHKKRRKIIRVQ